MMQAPIAWFLFQQVVDISPGFSSVFRDFWGAQKYALMPKLTVSSGKS
jgi:hypothetical protein